MSVVVPIEIHQEIVNYIFEEAERLPNDFYVNIMNLMKKYYEQEHFQDYSEIHTYLNKNKNRINGEIFKKIKDHFPEPPYFKFNCLKNCKYVNPIYCLIPFMIIVMSSVIIIAVIRK